MGEVLVAVASSIAAGRCVCVCVCVRERERGGEPLQLLRAGTCVCV